MLNFYFSFLWVEICDSSFVSAIRNTSQLKRTSRCFPSHPQCLHMSFIRVKKNISFHWTFFFRCARCNPTFFLCNIVARWLLEMSGWREKIRDCDLCREADMWQAAISKEKKTCTSRCYSFCCWLKRLPVVVPALPLFFGGEGREVGVANRRQTLALPGGFWRGAARSWRRPRSNLAESGRGLGLNGWVHLSAPPPYSSMGEELEVGGDWEHVFPPDWGLISSPCCESYELWFCPDFVVHLWGNFAMCENILPSATPRPVRC